MKIINTSLLLGLLGLSFSSHAAEYVYPDTCRNYNHVGLFEQCLDKELAFYDGKLNGLYFSFGANKDLERSEMLWIKFKETDCHYMAATAKNAVHSRLVYKACVLEKTKTRIDDLKKSTSYGEWFKTV